MSSSLLFDGAVGALVLVLALWYWSAPGSVPLPPGPRGNLIFGSALELRNSSAFWLTFAKYSDQYGPLVTVRMFIQKMVIVNDPRIAVELFEKKAAHYSDRYISQIAKLGGWDHDIIFMPYNSTLKYYRTLLQRALNNRAALDYVSLQEHEVRRYMKRLVEAPEDFMKHIHLMSSSIAIRMVYGYKVDSPNDQLIKAAEKVMAAFSDGMAPGRWFVEVFPILRHVPAWFPLAVFKRRILSWQKNIDKYQNDTFDFVKNQMAAGTAETSFASKLLQPESGEIVDGDVEHHIKLLASSLYGAGSDTTVSAVKSFFLAMTLYPDVQAKAQAEITEYLKQRPSDVDSPEFIRLSDRANLPYTSALVRELLRWHPVLNLVGHRSIGVDDENIVVGGKRYCIPAHTSVVVNAWQILHNPAVYSEPESFMPERYLVESPPPDPESYAFGFGRRICPGMHVAQQSMWLSISNTLANFTISKAKDRNGVDIVPAEIYTNDIISHPVPFICHIEPRRGRKNALLDQDI
ncbi:cytochrome P450 [Ceratobasidium sp. AG-I]|nr:cytochrome P450 [Ceratobasidium sp. AG-I]